ncbi:hypothetical protein B9Z19DRAFT_356817 [Tuber borchii]|uniref:ATP-dependent DNA helicase n=1 Tax=Tuber borchii TaxID=42251 RepID=A0A2T6ZIQ5_TUBBO|nr:hypothetical protein B9Z19DRAFT_356817 [Tuber borchii]
MLAEIGRRARKDPRPFGGIQLVFCGDFYQLPPVDKLEDRNCPACGQRLVTDVYRQYLSPSNPHLADVLHKRHMYSYGLDPKRWLRCTNHLNWRRATCDFLWNDTAKFAFQTTSWSGCKLKTVSLRTPHRHEGDEEWFNMLSEIRRGIVSPTTLEYLKTLDREPNISNSPIKPVLLHTKRRGVALHNLKELAQLSGRPYNYAAMDVTRYAETPSHQSHDLNDLDWREERVIRELDTKYSEFFESLQSAKQIQLKIGAQVMLLQNLNQQEGLVNGAKGRIVKFERYPYAVYQTGSESQHDRDMQLFFRKSAYEDGMLIPLVDFGKGCVPIFPYKQDKHGPLQYTKRRDRP